MSGEATGWVGVAVSAGWVGPGKVGSSVSICGVLSLDEALQLCYAA